MFEYFATCYFQSASAQCNGDLAHAPAKSAFVQVRLRNYAMLAVLLGCGLRRAELTRLTVNHLQQRDNHWAIIDLFGKGGHVRTVPVPDWVKVAMDSWLAVACIETGVVFRCVSRTGPRLG